MLSIGKKKVMVPIEEATAEYVPAAAVKVLSSVIRICIIGRKARLGGLVSLMWKCGAQLRIALETADDILERWAELEV